MNRPIKSSRQGIVPIVAYMALGALAQMTFSSMKKYYFSSTSPQRERIPGNAWTLIVTVTFKSEEDQKSILESWKPVTKYCAEKEPFLYHYEAGKNDADPLKLHFVERYESKEQYLNFHKSGEEFLKFRPKLKALQDAGKVEIEGFSYQELGYGFV